MVLPQISAIIPTYNSQDYLVPAIESLLKQEIDEFRLEIILIDDGSSDNTNEICKYYSDNYSNVRYYTQNHLGAGAARNLGIKKSSGQFVIFLDSDDLISKTFCKTLFNCFSPDIDIVECNYSSNLSDLELNTPTTDFEEYAVDKAILLHVNEQKFKQVIWNKMYRREVLNDIEFPVDKTIDDEFWTYKVILNSRRLIHVNTVLYFYRIRDDSVMRRASYVKRLEGLDALIKRHKEIVERFPTIEKPSCLRILNLSLYLGQVILLDSMVSKRNKYSLIKQIKSSGKSVLGISQFDSVAEKLWFFGYKRLFWITCKLRNVLKIY